MTFPNHLKPPNYSCPLPRMPLRPSAFIKPEFTLPAQTRQKIQEIMLFLDTQKTQPKKGKAIVLTEPGTSALFDGLGLINAWFEKKRSKTGKLFHQLWYYVGRNKPDRIAKFRFSMLGNIAEFKGKKRVQLKPPHIAALINDLHTDLQSLIKRKPFLPISK